MRGGVGTSRIRGGAPAAAARTLAAILLTASLVLAPPTVAKPKGSGSTKAASAGGGKKAKAEQAPAEHLVQPGECLGRIAEKVGCSVDEIRRANHIRGDKILAGQKLKIPHPCAGPTRAREGKDRVVEHVVLPGETLSGIALRYGSTVKAIKARNRLRSDLIRTGQKLAVEATVAFRERREFVYTIEAGDTLSGIASRYDMAVDEIARLNRIKNPRRLRIGDTIKLYRDGPDVVSETRGRPQGGTLVHGEQLPPGPGYYRRRPHHAFGTNETITQLLHVIAAVQKAHPKIHDLAIGDISAENGGHLAGHKSHQSGRDVDLGFYFEGQPAAGPKAFIRADRVPLDYEATWTLITSLAGRSAKTSRVEYMFIDYGVQQLLHDWAKKKKRATKGTLTWLFQYPRGRRAMRGLIRHEPGHAAHIHVRFKCPKGDPKCR